MISPAHLIFLFVDGVGLGPPGPSNPFAVEDLPYLNQIAGGQPWTATDVLLHPERFRGIDANLEIEGLPQSGTGQATLFTGINCAQLAGRHFGPYPHSSTHDLLNTNNVYHRLEQDIPGSSSAFANAYPDRFFRYMDHSGRWTVTTRAARGAGVQLRTHADLLAGNAISADLTGAGWPQADPDLVPVDSFEAGKRLHKISRSHRLTVFEYYRTDKAGHSMDAGLAGRTLRSLDDFVGGLISEFAAGDLLLVTSDHGNVEDLDVKTHTRNPVPLALFGESSVDAFENVRSIEDVAGAIVRSLGD